MIYTTAIKNEISHVYCFHGDHIGLQGSYHGLSRRIHFCFLQHDTVHIHSDDISHYNDLNIGNHLYNYISQSSNTYLYDPYTFVQSRNEIWCKSVLNSYPQLDGSNDVGYEFENLAFGDVVKVTM